MVIFLPSILFVIDNPRVNNAWTLPSMLFYDKNTYLEIIKAIILPSDVMSGPNHSILNSYNYKSIELFLPFVGAVLAFSYVFKNKKNWISILFIICLIFMFIPILNSSFFAFIIYLFVFAVCLIFLCLIMKFSKNKFLWILIGIILYTTFRGNYFFYQNKGTLSNNSDYVEEILTVDDTLDFSTKDVRYDFALGCSFNLGYLGNFPNIKTFNTNINGSNFEFW